MKSAANVRQPIGLEDAEAVVTRVLEQARDALSNSSELRQHFAGDLEWLEQRERLWRARVWRIGLIGVTSAGKSTLVNALLGERMLPSAVRPSSNTLVVCRKGARKSAFIHYVDGKTEHIDTALGERLAELSDEAKNPGNELGVREIEVVSPSFQLPSALSLVDTPGLDAHGYDEHENLTIEQFLPTVDVAVFLSTAKANSDGAIGGYLQTISAQGKPLVFVQNMIDSIEPKLGVGGTIVKDVDTVRRDHRLRLERLLARTLGESLASETPIVQVSAHWALAAHPSRGFIPELASAVAGHVDRLSPQLWAGRASQLQRHFSLLIERECRSTEVAVAADRADSVALEKTRMALERAISRFESELDEVGSGSRQGAQRTSREAWALKPKEVEEAERLADKFEKARQRDAAVLRKRLDAINNELRTLAASVNLTSDDFVIRSFRERVVRRVAVRAETQTETTTSKKKGFWSAVKRFFGSESGYETTTRTWREIDVARFSREIDELSSQHCAWVESIAESLLESAIEQRDLIIAEVNRQLRQLEARKRSQVRKEQCRRAAEEVRAALGLLRTLLESAPVTSAVERWHPSGSTPKLREAPALAGSLAMLSARIAAGRFPATRRALLNLRPPKRAVRGANRFLVYGWDIEAVEQSTTRFFSDRLAAPARPTIGVLTNLETKSGGDGELGTFVDADDRTRRSQPAVMAQKFVEKAPTVLFVVVDCEQVGSTANMVARSHLPILSSKAIATVLILQSVRGVLNAQTFAEALLELKRIIREFNLQVLGVLANSSILDVSFLADALIMRGEELRTLADEQQWSRGFRGNALASDLDIPAILRSWREQIPKRGGER